MFYHDGQRHWKYAVIALEKGNVEQLMEHRRKEGYPRMENAKGDAAKIRGIVAAAQRKGQGLLLTVEEIDEDDYEWHKERKGDMYYKIYGKHPRDTFYP
jgi:hypothetical protein